MLDLLIRDATIVDGTGGPSRRGDIGVRDGRIVSHPGTEEATRVVDAHGLVLAPGFVDIHTHYDAQLFWDPFASPSPLHGVTTIVGGNCGFTLAPMSPEHVGYIMRMMARVEGIPLATLQDSLTFDWTDFGSYLDRFEGKIGVNAGFLVGHSTIRRFVMGDASVQDEATPEQIKAMVELLHESLAGGGLGFTSSQQPPHVDGDGRPVPSRLASRDELVALAGAVKDHPGTQLALSPGGSVKQLTEQEVDLLTDMSVAGERPINWNVIRVSAEHPEYHEHQLRASDYAAERGGRVITLIQPHELKMRGNFLTGFCFDGLRGWHDTLKLPVEERIRALSDPDVRRMLKESAEQEAPGSIFYDTAQWERITVGEVYAPENAGFQDRTIGDIAAELGKEPFDVLCDIVVADELRTGLDPQFGRSTPEDLKLRSEVWQDDRTIVGGSDSGAHLDAQCGPVWSTDFLAEGVRKHHVISLEEAVRQLTDVPARMFGIRDRGRIEDGWYADLVLFDPEVVEPHPIRQRFDLPGGAPRYYAEADGVEHVWVNGTEVAAGGKLTGALAGHVIRSGRDTDTVPVKV